MCRKAGYLLRKNFCQMLRGSGVNITTEGKSYLGAPLGTTAAKVDQWVKEIDHLAKIAHSQTQSAYCALTNGLISRWNYLMRVVPDLGDKLQPIEEALRFRLLPAITGRSNISDAERCAFALPARDGGLRIPIPTEAAAEQYRASRSITEPLVALCTGQNTKPLPNTYIVQEELKGETKKHRRKKQQETSKKLEELTATYTPKAVELASEKGASTWLTTLPIRAHGFSLHKQAFRDALCIRYGWDPQGLPSHCLWCSVQHHTCLQLPQRSISNNQAKSHQRLDSPASH